MQGILRSCLGTDCSILCSCVISDGIHLLLGWNVNHTIIVLDYLMIWFSFCYFGLFLLFVLVVFIAFIIITLHYIFIIFNCLYILFVAFFFWLLNAPVFGFCFIVKFWFCVLLLFFHWFPVFVIFVFYYCDYDANMDEVFVFGFNIIILCWMVFIIIDVIMWLLRVLKTIPITFHDGHSMWFSTS